MYYIVLLGGQFVGGIVGLAVGGHTAAWIMRWAVLRSTRSDV